MQSPVRGQRLTFGVSSQPGSGHNSPRAHGAQSPSGAMTPTRMPLSRAGSVTKSSQLTSPAGTGASPDLAQYISNTQAQSRRGSNLGPHHDSSPIHWHSGLLAVTGNPAAERRAQNHDSTEVQPFVPDRRSPPAGNPGIKKVKSAAWMEVQDTDEDNLQSSPRGTAMLPQPPQLGLAQPTTLHVPAASRRKTTEAALPGQPGSESAGGPAAAASPTGAGTSFTRPQPPAALAGVNQSGTFGLPMPKLTVAWTEGQQSSKRPVAEGDSESSSPDRSRQPSGTMKRSASSQKWL
mmetsp:Transcript_7738/g.19223  ORF Transcript_7738/g.19223 Transcript_7738/m.19223 type:complete len:292 (-) Transcript_7738:496-1371(-)